MVSCCVINGCKNNGINKENDPSVNIFFHEFPLNPVLKASWLKAIGQSDWEPPDYARICNDHFNAFHLNSKFEGLQLEVCRICLATDDDVTLYSLQQGKLKQYMDTILPINIQNDSSLPQFVCSECAAHLRKCYNMIKRSETSQAVLLEIFENNGEITKSLIKNLNREILQLKSSLQHHSVVPTYQFDYQFNYEKNLSFLTNIKYIYDLNEDKIEINTEYESISIQTYHNDNDNNVTENFKQDSNCVIELESDHVSCDDNETDVGNAKELSIFISDDENNSNLLLEQNSDGFTISSISSEENNKKEKKDADCVMKSLSDHVSSDDNETDVENSKNNSAIYIDNGKNRVGSSKESTDRIPISADESNKNDLKNVNKRVQKSKIKSKKDTTQSRKQSIENEANKSSFTKHCNIVNLITLREKIDAWNKAMENPSWMKNKANLNNVHKCEVCSKLFAKVKTYEQHRAYHNPNRGNVECPVCKIRHKCEKSLMKHMDSHSRKYYCKLCPKSFFADSVARKHYSEHIGKEYKCERCSFSCRARATLSAHVQNNHSHAFACALCGRSCVSRVGLQRHHELQHHGQPPAPEGDEVFSCEECKFKFNSENALRVHLLTSVQHKNASYVNPALKNSCKLCGASFQSDRELLRHKDDEHGNLRRNIVNHPTQCEYCDTSLSSRRQYYFHMRQQHPTKIYKPVVTAVCATCGKGYASEALLRYHELRHGSPRERCDQCGRMFFDKRALRSHCRHSHSDERRYSCPECDRAFKQMGNLDRHMKIHTDATPYECSLCDKHFKHKENLKVHILRVHHKILYPSQIKRNRKRTRKRTEDSEGSLPRRDGTKCSATTSAYKLRSATISNRT